MKVTMLAIVLLVASVIVLIFANTLNSWVLGGLIGGLAALLISIPISLVIFTSLARRHDERLFAQMAEPEDYEIEGDEYAGVYEAEAYIVPQEEETYYLEDEYYDEDEYRYEEARANQVPDQRRLPAPGPARQPAHVFQQSGRENRHTGHQRQPRSTQTTRSLRSQQQSAALRAAMREAEQERIDQGEMPGPSYRAVTPRRQLAPKSRLHRSDQEPMSFSRATPNTRRSTAQGNEQGARRPQRTGDLQTSTRQGDQSSFSPDTGPVRWHPDTDKIASAPQLDAAEYSTTESWSGALNNPMVRRAPYLYKDDPLHEHFAQQVEKPIARRSSRYLHPQEEQ